MNLKYILFCRDVVADFISSSFIGWLMSFLFCFDRVISRCMLRVFVPISFCQPCQCSLQKLQRGFEICTSLTFCSPASAQSGGDADVWWSPAELVEVLCSPETSATIPDIRHEREMKHSLHINTLLIWDQDCVRYLDVHVEQPDEAALPGVMRERVQDYTGGSVFSPTNKHRHRLERDNNQTTFILEFTWQTPTEEAETRSASQLRPNKHTSHSWTNVWRSRSLAGQWDFLPFLPTLHV